jgi:predicted ATPase
MTTARSVRLSLDAMRSDSPVVPNPVLGVEGGGLPSVLALWRGAYPELGAQLDDFVKRCVPEVKNVLVKPSPLPGHQRLWVQMAEHMFDVNQISDGLLYFIALAMIVLDAGRGSVLMIEEPETSIHPRRLSELFDFVRSVVSERGCQVVLSTHSPVLVNELRDEPDSILVFRRGPQGTKVDPLTSFPHLMQALSGEGDRRASPGEMLTDGFLNEPR